MQPHRRIPRIILPIALGALVLPGAHAHAAANTLAAAINANNVTELAALAASAPTAAQRSLAEGALLALRHRDSTAIAELLPVTRSRATRAVRARAYLVLANVYLVQQRYRDCYAAIHSALELSPHSVQFSDRQTMAFTRALRSIPPMQVLHSAAGSLRFRRDRAGMIRIRVKIGRQSQEAVLDTGANFSTISTSAAKRTGVRMLPQAVSVGSSTREAVPTQLGIARRVQIGDTVLSNVVFIVLPDSALTFPHGYRIDAIIGLPVLMELGRLEFSNSDTPTFSYGRRNDRRSRHADSHSNLLLSGLEPLVLAHVAGASTTLRMELDSGANATGFNRNAVADAPVLMQHAAQHILRLGGAGGVVTERKALRLAQVALVIGGRRFALKDVAVSSHSSAGSDGTLGQDVLRRGARWTLNFQSMTLRIRK